MINLIIYQIHKNYFLWKECPKEGVKYNSVKAAIEALVKINLVSYAIIDNITT